MAVSTSLEVPVQKDTIATYRGLEYSAANKREWTHILGGRICSQAEVVIDFLSTEGKGGCDEVGGANEVQLRCSFNMLPWDRGFLDGLVMHPLFR